MAHLLQGEDNLDGSRPGPSGIEASAMRDAEWDYIFLQGAYPEGSAVPEAKLAEMRYGGGRRGSTLVEGFCDFVAREGSVFWCVG